MFKILQVFILLLISNSCFAVSLSNTLLIKTHLEAITKTKEFRNYQNIEQPIISKISFQNIQIVFLCKNIP